jgi:hypothetical protein
MNPKINRVLYGGFVALGLYYLLVQRDPGTAIAQIGIALVFDPFNPDQPWGERPRWQKIWLYTHLAVMALIVGMWMGTNDAADAAKDAKQGFFDGWNGN